MLISLHIPKTAGGSFLEALSSHFGTRLRQDYADFPINTPPLRRKLHALTASLSTNVRKMENIDCVHGHFLVCKYALYRWNPKTKFITWMRDPVERLASHYYYWKRVYDPKTAQPLHRKVIEENWSLERFSLGPELKNTFCQFTWGFPFERFDFIGLAEHYEEDLAFFAREYLGSDLPVHEKNVMPGDRGEIHIGDPKFRATIEKHHAKDMLLYREAREKRLTRTIWL